MGGGEGTLRHRLGLIASLSTNKHFPSWYLNKRNQDNIDHSAHFWGAVYGLLFPLAFRPDIFIHFLKQLQS